MLMPGPPSAGTQAAGPGGEPTVQRPGSVLPPPRCHNRPHRGPSPSSKILMPQSLQVPAAS